MVSQEITVYTVSPMCMVLKRAGLDDLEKNRVGISDMAQ